ncbi:MAG: LptF/LptG family permease [Puniceicoccales bacterium]|jgi:lipopolysaccharide export system permease protein|nr:LptF/LptG family permease [Puniceicoccales bacterium]
MNRLQRHLFGQVAVAVAMAVGLFVFVMTTTVLLREVFPKLASGIISWGQFVQLLLIAIPGILPYALPMGVLTGVLIVLGRMSAQNEILAMKASGMSLWRISVPIFFLALLGVGLSTLINFEYAPRANDTLKRIVSEAVRLSPSTLIVPGEFSTFGGKESRERYVLYARERNESHLGQVWVWQLNRAGQIIRVIQAAGADMQFDEANGLFRLTVHDALQEEYDRNAPENFSGEPVLVRKAALLPITMPLDDMLSGKAERTRKLRHCTLSELLEFRSSGSNLKPEDRADPEKFHANRIAIQLQIQTYLTNAFGILSLTMIAIPLGIKTSRSETLVNAALALALALSYYVLTMMASWIRDPFYRADILVWLPNFLFQGVGGWLLSRSAKT